MDTYRPTQDRPSSAWPTLAIALGAASAVAAAALLAHGWLTTSPRFAVGRVDVAGNSRVTRESILARAGVTPGTNVFAVDLGAIEEAVGRDPWIAEVRAERRLPDRIRVAITERRAAALVRLGSLYLADAGGRLFKPASIQRGEGDGLVAISGLDRRLWSAAADPDAGPALIRMALSIVGRWHAEPTRPTIGEVELSRGGTTMYTLEGAVAVRLGTATAPDDLDERFHRFDVAWKALTAEERAAARTIHLDSATRRDRVTVRLARTGGPKAAARGR
jgi:hypothetical protein